MLDDKPENGEKTVDLIKVQFDFGFENYNEKVKKKLNKNAAKNREAKQFQAYEATPGGE